MTTNSIQKGSLIVILKLIFTVSIFSQIYVDINAGPGGDGTSWASAFREIQTALSASTSGDELWVAEGNYLVIGNEDASFEVPSGVALYGGFNGTETLRTQRNWETNLTSLDGNNSTNTILYFENASSSTIVDGFIIENGDADGTNSRGRSGAAIYIDVVVGGTLSSPQILNCIIKNNSSDNGGGAVYIDGSFSSNASPTFQNCTFDNNFSNADGGAIYVNATFGGASNANYLGCTFQSNHSVGSGGGLFMHGGGGNTSSTFKKCNFDSNVAEGNGGAIYSLGTSSGQANHTIINSRFYANTGFAAGGIYSNGGNNGDASPTITNCVFHLNEATGNGGTGGAIYNNGDNGGQSNTSIQNCIIWGNIAPYGTHALKNVNCSPSISYSLVDTDNCTGLNNGTGSNISCGAGMIYNIDPLFEDAANGDLHIMDTSPAKNTGDDSANSETNDLDENPRFVGIIDLGPYETSGLLPVDLAYFNAHKKGSLVELNWATYSEIEHDYFIVERSNDARNFEEIDRIEGAGISNSFKSYQLLDKNPKPGDNYYRIKSVSLSKTVEHSELRLVRFEDQTISIFPNPVKDQLQIQFDENYTEDALIEIYSAIGKRVYSSKINSSVTGAIINLEEEKNIVPGTYILSIHLNNATTVHQRFIKQ